ncbi:serine hydrolase [Candidatus Parcubacteria bacterium]|nr:serine hydrolase [Patescibacteria group bacterium]MBU4466656.1 serine hydrolase [Patescibacteria group bacterium]MCG2688423.1 serine hydrolase [Candidatus Parcubacteria bacterium]
MKRIKFFAIGIGISLAFSLSVNSVQFAMEDFLINQVYFPDKILLAQVSREGLNRKNPIDFNIKAKAALVIKISNDGDQTILFDQNSSAKMPIASLTKLMTAVISLDNQQLSRIVEISQPMILQEWSSGNLKIGEKITVGELLKMALVESNNDAANALAEVNGRENFINLMNLKAAEIGLRSTRFSNSTGLEAENNFSTARDMANLAILILKKYPLEILKISAQPSVIVLSENGERRHQAFNTNELLNSFSQIDDLKIIGGKTGYTDESGGCVIIILQDKDNDYFINVILGTDSRESRFSEMRKLIDAFNNENKICNF